MGHFIGAILRLVGTIGVLLGMLIVAVIINSIFLDSDILTVLMIAVVECALVCIVNQVLYDVLDWGILDNFFGKMIKLIVFFAVSAIIVVLEVMMITGGMGIENEGGIITGTFFYAATLAGGVATFLFCRTISESNDDGFWALALLAVGISLGAGLVLEILSLIIPSIAGFLGWFGFIASTGLVVFHMLANGIPYTDTVGVLNIGSFRRSGSSSSSSASSSSSSGYSGTTGATVEYEDKRGTGFGDLTWAMSDVANKYSKTVYISCSCTLYIKIRSIVSGGTITFNIGGECKLSSYVQSQYDVDSVQHDVERELKDAAESVMAEAERQVDKLREKYSNYDRAYNIEVNGTGVKFVQ